MTMPKFSFTLLVIKDLKYFCICKYKMFKFTQVYGY